MMWFGPRHGAPYEADTERVSTPVGARCARCDEVIGWHDSGLVVPHWAGNAAPLTSRPYHYECHLRGVIGGLNHLLGRCTCCGGTEPPDPGDMSRREAAHAAVNYWNTRR